MTGPPLAICFLNRGTTEPLEPRTLPKRTATNSVFILLVSNFRYILTPSASTSCWKRRGILSTLPSFMSWLNDCMTISHRRLLAPIILVGFTALSVDIKTKRSQPLSMAACAVLYVPMALFLMASHGLSSMSGTCLWAAAWYTI